MTSLGNLVVVAQRLLEKIGNGAPEVLEYRARQHADEGDVDSARYWRRVAKTIRSIVSLRPGYHPRGRLPRPLHHAPSLFRQVFHATPQASVLLQPNLVILDANSAFLELMTADIGELVGTDMFAAFPANPADKDGRGQERLTASVVRVVETARSDRVTALRYDLRDRHGRFEERWWDATNAPVLDEKGRVCWIIQQIRENRVRTAVAPATALAR